MTLTLVLGVLDVPYVRLFPPQKMRVSVKRRRVAKGVWEDPEEKALNSSPMPTTFQVAGWLENKYHVMESFYEWAPQRWFDGLVLASLKGVLKTILQGGGAPENPFAGAEEEITAGFKDFLTRDIMATLGIPGVPTKASLMGVNHRMKSGFNPGHAPRPSFIDTTLYQESFRAWVETS